ncbi:site-2 protease family protein [Baekduia soli]|uniref:Site-2 protease family protein n=1 Tax=Baekduia soli TaxID=496014 RepID=A0A5B8U3Z6_9ACTN|nr:site-2 protease family protein [Baekduia soli]QEC47763.1 site-2 protease family protein [Baekduia soli]
MNDERWLPPRSPASDPPVTPAAADEGLGPAQEERRGLLARLLAPLAALVALAGKFKAVLLVLTKAKFLVTSGSMLVSIGAYALIWGWQFGVGFVLLLLVHEYGHVIQLRREGVKDAGAPIFIPFLGALIWAKSLGKDAAAEARVGLAGPVLGSIAAAACIGLYALTGNHLFQALAFTGFFLNLFNLLPVGFLDGARAAAALSPWVWLLGVFGIVVLVFVFPNPLIILIAVLGIWETWQRFRAFRGGGEDIERYYAIPRRQRIIIGATYLLLIIALVIALDVTHLQRDIPN